MRLALALARNDLFNLRRDPLLVYLALVPWLMVVLVRLAVPGLTVWLQETYRVDLHPYYPLIISFFFVMEIPMIIGVVMGLLLLDERDDGVLTALGVTPVSGLRFLRYRLWLMIGFSAAAVLVCTPMTGMLPAAAWPRLVPIAVGCSLFAPLLALIMAVFAGNKLEGLALMKAFGVLLVGPLAAYFIPSQWQLILGVFPSYWWARAYWAMESSGEMWACLSAGTVYHGVLILWLVGRFRRRTLI
jgi:fluoroquinolone transport system permease protein